MATDSSSAYDSRIALASEWLLQLLSRDRNKKKESYMLCCASAFFSTSGLSALQESGVG